MKNQEGKHHIPVDSFLILLFGPGISLSSNALSHLSNNDCFIAISSSAQIPKVFLTTFNSIGNADYTFVQVEKYLSKTERINIVKNLLSIRFNNNRFTDKLKTVNEIMLKEARWTKNIYKKVFGKEFKRNFNRDADVINKNINIANNALYNYCGAIIHLMGLCPHIGFLHGKKRNAFIFDLSEIIKTEEYYIIIRDSNSIKEMLSNVSRFIYDKKQQIILEFIENVFGKNTEPQED